MKCLYEFTHRISGIPCIISITDYDPGEPAVLNGPIDIRSPSVHGFIDFIVCDRNGRHAPWIERKLSNDGRTEIEYIAEQKLKEFYAS